MSAAAGAVAGTGRGVPVIGVVVGLAICAAGIAVYVRDPARALMWLWVAVVVNAPLSVWAGYNTAAGQHVRQLNEVLVLLLVVLSVWRASQTNVRIPLRFILPSLAFAGAGLAGAVANHVPLGVTATGAWLALKLWVMVAVALVLPWRMEDLDRIYALVIKVGVMVAAFAVADFAVHGALARAVHLQPQFAQQAGDPRGNAVQSIFFHPQELSLFMSMLFALTFARFAGKRRGSDLAFSLLFAAAVLVSLRLQGFLAVATVVLIVVAVQNGLGGRRRLGVLLAGVALVAGIYVLESSVISSQLSLYTSSGTTARRQLYTTGERVAQANFPIGAGFGRYGTYTSRIHYSPIYDQYGLSSTYGLSRKYPLFIDDTSWPGVLGETGFAGIAAYLAGLILLIVSLIRRFRTVEPANKWVPLAALCAVAVIIIDSLGSASLFDWLPATTLVLILGPALAAKRRAANSAQSSLSG